MKSTKVITGTIAFALTLILASCGSSNDKIIVGKWKISDMKFSDLDVSKFDAAQKEAFDKQMTEMKEKSYLEIKEDGSFENLTVIDGAEDKSTGKIHLSEDRKQLLIEEGEATDTIKVVSISDSKMEWEIEGNTVIYVK